jgi:hypothetical protein
MGRMDDVEDEDVDGCFACTSKSAIFLPNASISPLSVQTRLLLPRRAKAGALIPLLCSPTWSIPCAPQACHTEAFRSRYSGFGQRRAEGKQSSALAQGERVEVKHQGDTQVKS